MAGVHELTPALGAGPACRALGLWRGAPARQQARLHRKTFVGPMARRADRPSPPLALDTQERQELLATLNGERFADTAPAAVHATLLDEGRYLGSVRTMYRLLAANGGSRERRAQLTHPAYAKPELLATAPNQVWSWDITKLKGPAKWTCFHLYVNPGHLQPRRGRLADRSARERGAGRAAHCRHRGAARGAAGHADPAR
jgi:putative transposase